jgi:putative ABC transport system substrate-binding protein
MRICLQRREFFGALGGAAAWPLTARAQQRERMRRIGWLASLDENDPMPTSFVSAFAKTLSDLGWTVGRNVRIDIHWGGGDINRVPALTQELVGLQPCAPMR